MVLRVSSLSRDSGGARQLGISNQYDLPGFRRLFADARVKPAVLQNRFYAESGYDVDLREFCRENDVVYQSFWTLTANRDILFDEARGGGVKKGTANEVGRVAARAVVAAAAAAHGKTPAQVWFRWLQQGLGVAPLSGTTDPAHMAQDLDVFMNDGDFALTVQEMNAIEAGLFSSEGR